MNQRMHHVWSFWSKLINNITFSCVENEKFWRFNVFFYNNRVGIECGPLTLGNLYFTRVCFETHSMSSNVEMFWKCWEETKKVLNVSNGFWGIENIEAKHNCMIYNFEKNISTANKDTWQKYMWQFDFTR